MNNSIYSYKYNSYQNPSCLFFFFSNWQADSKNHIKIQKNRNQMKIQGIQNSKNNLKKEQNFEYSFQTF